MGRPAAARGIFGAGSSFCVGLRVAGREGGGGVDFCFSGGILLVLAELSFWRGDWALGYHSMEFKFFSNVS